MGESDGYKMPSSSSVVENGGIGKLTLDSSGMISVYRGHPQGWGSENHNSASGSIGGRSRHARPS